MTYNPNIPQANDLISQSQAQIQTNFSQLDTIFDVDHVTFDNSTVGDRGKHRHSTYVEQSVDATTAVNEIALYAKDLAGAETLYLRKESNGTVIQMSGADPVVAGSGSTFLPGGLILKWGIKTSPGTSSTITFAGGAFPNNVFSITLAAVRGTSTPHSMYINNGSVTTSSFGVRSDDASFDAVYYMAIGN